MFVGLSFINMSPCFSQNSTYGTLVFNITIQHIAFSHKYFTVLIDLSIITLFLTNTIPTTPYFTLTNPPPFIRFTQPLTKTCQPEIVKTNKIKLRNLQQHRFAKVFFSSKSVWLFPSPWTGNLYKASLSHENAIYVDYAIHLATTTIEIQIGLSLTWRKNFQLKSLNITR